MLKCVIRNPQLREIALTCFDELMSVHEQPHTRTHTGATCNHKNQDRSAITRRPGPGRYLGLVPKEVQEGAL